jgi:hypothetical protein
MTIVRCLTIGLSGAELTELPAPSVDAFVDRPRPHPDETAAAPATNEAANPPAVTIADFLFTPHLLASVERARSSGTGTAGRLDLATPQRHRPSLGRYGEPGQEETKPTPAEG